MKYFPGCSNLEDMIDYELFHLARRGTGGGYVTMG